MENISIHYKNPEKKERSKTRPSLRKGVPLFLGSQKNVEVGCYQRHESEHPEKKPTRFLTKIICLLGGLPIRVTLKRPEPFHGNACCCGVLV